MVLIVRDESGVLKGHLIIAGSGRRALRKLAQGLAEKCGVSVKES
jgi:hypothetical protein